MSDFRRFVISIAEGVLIIGMVLGTISMAIVGMSIGSALGFASGAGQAGPPAFIGFFVGGGIGFVVSAVCAAVVFMLAEAAEHTRQTAEYGRQTVEGIRQLQAAIERSARPLDHTNSHPRPGQREVPPAPAEFVRRTPSPSDVRPTDQATDFPYSAEMQRIVASAEAQGYAASVEEKKITFTKEGGPQTYCYSAADVRRFARFAKLF